MRDQILPKAQLVTTAVAARILNLTPDGVRWLARTRQLPFEDTGTPQRLYRRSEVLRLASKRADARGQRREELLAEVRPQMVRAGLSPRQLRIRVVRGKVARGESVLRDPGVKVARSGAIDRESDKSTFR
jgi:hypothetical protein